MEKSVSGIEVPWNEEAASMLAGSTGNEPTYSISDLRREVEIGKAQLFMWSYGGEKLGYCVLWIDPFGDHLEMVIQAGAAFKSNARAFRLVMPIIEAKAIEHGCYGIRSHLVDGKWASQFRSAKYYKSETIMRKRLR